MFPKCENHGWCHLNVGDASIFLDVGGETLRIGLGALIGGGGGAGGSRIVVTDGQQLSVTSGNTYTNEGATADVEVLLPSSASILDGQWRARFVGRAAEIFRVLRSSTDVIVYDPTSGVSLETNEANTFLDLEYVGGGVFLVTLMDRWFFP